MSLPDLQGGGKQSEMHHFLPLLVLGTSVFALNRESNDNSWDGPFQNVPSTGQPDNTFDDPNYVDPHPEINQDPSVNFLPPKEYRSRPFDIPFAALSFGQLNMFKKPQLNDPNRLTESGDTVAGRHDSTKNSACGIPDAAYSTSKVAIHPYWLKYAPPWLGLSRYCMQDACISVWNETGAKDPKESTDIELKITDICSTDPDDPSYCESPSDIMMDRAKAQLLFNTTKRGDAENQALQHGARYPHKVWWFFSKCWDDGLIQGKYNHSSNWFADPPLPNNVDWHRKAMQEQQKNNCGRDGKTGGSYREKGRNLPCYLDGALKQDYQRFVVSVSPLFPFHMGRFFQSSLLHPTVGSWKA